MYILKVTDPVTKLTDYTGPFGTVDRAHEYAKSIPDWQKMTISTQPLIVPYNIVKQIIWRSNDN